MRTRADTVPRIDTPPGPLLARGREASIHRLGAASVLRRYDDARDLTTEVAVMRHVVRHGFPAPAVQGLHVDDAGQVDGMVLERLDGPTLIEEALTGRAGPLDVGRTLASLHDRLHRVPVVGLPVLPGPGMPGPDDVVVHLDLHPANVMLAAGAPVVIDWAMARTGPASLDTAMTAMTLAAAVVAGIPADAGDVAGLEVTRSFVHETLVAYLAAVSASPMPSLPRAAAVLDLVGAQRPVVVRAALRLVRRLLEDGYQAEEGYQPEGR